MAEGARPPAPHDPTLVTLPPGRWWRAHPFDAATGRWAADAFNDDPRADARFSPLRDAAGRVVPSLYAARSEEGALMESVLRDVPFPSTGYQHRFARDRAGPYHLSPVEMRQPLRLVDLTSAGLAAMGLRPSDLFESNRPDYPRTREWAVWWRERQPAAQGLYWMSRRFNEVPVLVLWADRVPPGTVLPLAPPRHVRHFEALTLQLLERLGGSAAPEVLS